MSQDNYTSLQKPSEADPLLEQVFTPAIASDKGFIPIVDSSASLTGVDVYMRKLPNDVTHYCVTHFHIVTCLTVYFEIAMFAAKSRSKRGRSKS